MEEYHTAHKTICEETINPDNILALNNMLKNMKYTDMEMELEGEFRPPNPEKPCHCISSFTIKSINLNENIDNFIKEIGYKIEFSLETPSTEVIGHDRIVKMFSEKYPSFKYLILFIKKDLMRDVKLSGTSIEIILLSFLEEHEEYINKDIGDDNNNTIINIIKDLLIYLENFEEHNVIRLKNYYNYMGEIVTLQKKSEEDLGTEDLLTYYNQQIEKFETYIDKDAKTLIIHPISLKIIWGGYPNMAKGPRETVYENLKINCREFRYIYRAVRTYDPKVEKDN